MDKKLLDALDNLSESLDLISRTLSEKKGESSTAKALEGGNFGTQIKEISNGIKKLQADNQKILKNQNTILAMSKKKDDKQPNIIGDVGADKKQESNIKKGAGTILLIAVAVLAIGMAFKIVGKIDFLSVIGLALAITIISIAFEKISKLNITRKQAFDTSIVLVMISGAITISSWILSFIKPIGLGQAITGILIAAMFAVVSTSLDKMTDGINKFQKHKVNPAILILSLVAISGAITLSSWILSGIKPIGLGQAITGILIAAMFAVVSISLDKMAKGVKTLQDAKVNPLILILSLVAIATAITASSWILSAVKPIGLGQAITGILIAVMFAAISLFMPQLAKGIAIIDKSIGISKIWIIPVVFIAISIAIMISSAILAKTTPVPFMTLLNIVMMSIVLAIAAVVIGIASWVLAKVGIANVLKGSIAIVVIAAAIMASSWLLDKGTYNNYPDWKWALGVGLSLLIFSVPIIMLGIIAMTGIGALAILAGAAMTLVVASTIVGTSYILGKGDYNKYPTLEWALGTGLSMTAFGLAMLALGIIAITGIGALAIMAGGSMVLLVAETIVKSAEILGKGNYNKYPTFDWATGVGLALTAFGMGMLVLGGIAITGIGYLAILAGSEIILMISETIVESAAILNKGKFTGGPTKAWAEGISLALGAFTPVYGMLMANSIMSIFGGGGASPSDFATAIETISNGIITAAGVFGKSPGIWKNGPTKQWAEGVGTAIGAFAPVYKILSESSGFFKGPSVEDMKKSIMAISQGIVDAANFFGQNTAAFDISKIPSKTWGENVGSAIGAFMPALDFISKNSGIFSNGTDMLLGGIKSVTSGIVQASISLSEGKYDSSIPAGWIDGIAGNVKAYVDLAKYVSSNYESKGGGIVGAVSSAIFGSNNPMDNVIDGMTKLGNAYVTLGKSIKNFGNSISGIDIEKLSTIRAFTSNIVLMSLMDPDMFEDMLDKLEEKAGVMVDMISDINESGEKSDNKLKSVPTSGGSKSGPDQTQNKILQILSSMDSKLGTIAKNSGTLADYTNELRTGSGVKIKK